MLSHFCVPRLWFLVGLGFGMMTTSRGTLVRTAWVKTWTRSLISDLNVSLSSWTREEQQ
jgi:hypothetical protein